MAKQFFDDPTEFEDWVREAAKKLSLREQYFAQEMAEGLLDRSIDFISMLEFIGVILNEQAYEDEMNPKYFDIAYAGEVLGLVKKLKHLVKNSRNNMSSGE